jgi:hypothetical protein
MFVTYITPRDRRCRDRLNGEVEYYDTIHVGRRRPRSVCARASSNLKRIR